ncbi:uncharacterized protein LOC144551450 [Carex rostrata]
MRNRNENRNISPEYGHSLFRNRVIPPEYSDPRGDATWHHMSISRQPQINLSPLRDHQFRQSPDRSDFRPERLGCGSRVKRDHQISEHQSRYKHSPKVPKGRYCHHNIHVSSYTDPDHQTELSPELQPQPMVSRKPVPLDCGPGRSQSVSQKQESIPNSGTRSMGSHQYCRQVQDSYDVENDRGTKRAMVLRQSEILQSGTTEPSHLRIIEGGSSSYQHNRLYYMTQEDVPRATVPQSPAHLSSRRKSRYWVDDNDVVGDDMHRKASYPSPDYSGAEGAAHSSRNAMEGKVSTDPLNHSRLRDLGCLPRSMQWSLAQRDGYESDTDGAPISQRERIENQVDNQYDDIVGDGMHRKASYPSPDYSGAEGAAHSSRNARKGKVSTDPLNHSRLRDLGCLSRSMQRPLAQRDGYKSDTDGAPISQRERMENPIFSDSVKGLCNVYYSPPRAKLSYLQMRGNKYHVHQVDNCDGMYDHADSACDTHANAVGNANSDAEDEGSDYCYNQRRVVVQDELRLSSPLAINYKSYPVRGRCTVTIGKPHLMHRQRYDPNAMVDPNELLTNSVKKRLWSSPSDFIKKNSQPSKFPKRGCEDKPKPNGRNLNYGITKGSDEDATGMGSPVKDPPEGSEEFKRQAERAFLKYARVINDSACEKRKLLQPWKGRIHCYVCGRHSSKEFADIHNLVMHTFHAQNPGLKTAHRGLQKALCLSFGWNWCVEPDESKLYQLGPADEAELLKQDLILWPPIVVICNSSVDSMASKSKVVGLEAIECMLKGILGEGKAKFSFGKPSDQSIILVKLPPVYSGFVLAEKLHVHFSQSNHGKDQLELFLKSRSDSRIDKNTKETETEDVLYGYLAGIDDLDKLDSVTKKMYEGQKDIFKSRMEIAARAASYEKAAD